MVDNAIERLNEALNERYTVERQLGEGGMATVYLAQDVKHNRKVALKVLKPELSAVVGAERFLAEIETTANLPHPHVLPLFDSGEADGFLFYVMPYVEGETLRERLARDKQLSIEESVRIGTAVAGALDYAHRHGVVHRDIKPANILIQDGQPVVSDFGIALAVGAGGGARLTETGLSVGTPFYMSPEQATGDQHIGPASDIYSLGCVIYEMLVGEPPFLGNTAQAVLGKIIQGGLVSATEMRKSVPANIDAAIRKSLEKLPADRFRTGQDLARALGDPSFRHGAGAVTVEVDLRWRRAALGFAATSVLFLGGLLWSAFGTPEPVPRVERFASPFLQDQEPDGLAYQFFDLSPDGSFLVYRTGSILWVRRWEDLEATQIRGSNESFTPSISPDGTAVSFYLTSGEIKVASLAGGPVRTLLQDALPWQHWGDDGRVYATTQDRAVVRVSPDGGVADTLWRAPEGELQYVIRVLPDGERVVVAWGSDDPDTPDEIRLVELATGEGPTITAAEWGKYLSSGELLFHAPDSTLMVGRLDERRGAFSEGPVPLVEGVVAFDVADDGSLFYTTGDATGDELELVWVTRDGSALPVEAGWTFDPDVDNRGWEISPDGTKIALKARTDLGNDIWVKELPEGPLSRLTIHEAADRMPRWHPNGRDVTFMSNRGGPMAIWSRRADGVGDATLVYADERGSVFDVAWSPNTEWLVLRIGGIAGVTGGRDLYALHLGVDSIAQPLLVSEFDEFDPAISPDGKWIAHVSTETGQPEVFVRPFPDVNSGKVQISDGGGRAPVWSPLGSEIFYVRGEGTAAGEDASLTDRHLMVAELRPGPPMAVTRRRELFEIPGSFYFANVTTSFDITPDGERFLMARLANQETPDRRRFVLVKNALKAFREGR